MNVRDLVVFFQRSDSPPVVASILSRTAFKCNLQRFPNHGSRKFCCAGIRSYAYCSDVVLWKRLDASIWVSSLEARRTGRCRSPDPRSLVGRQENQP